MSDSIYYSSTDAGVAAIILSFLAAYFVIILVIGIVCYVFNSLSLYQMAKNRGFDSPWLAWIPIAKTYLMGKIINEKVAFGSWVIPYAHVFLPLLPFASGLLFHDSIHWLAVPHRLCRLLFRCIIPSLPHV